MLVKATLCHWFDHGCPVFEKNKSAVFLGGGGGGEATVPGGWGKEPALLPQQGVIWPGS